MVFLLFAGCLLAQDNKSPVFYNGSNVNFPYDLENPDRKWELEDRLNEISGLGFIDEDRLACIQDEKGNIYIFSLESGEVERKIDFEKDGDYEGIEVVGDDAWIIRSQGDLYRVSNFMDQDRRETKKFKTLLSKGNEPEGIGYDAVNDGLLIACKGAPLIEEDNTDFKAVYFFDLFFETLFFLRT